MKRTVMLENLMLVLLALVVTWVITAYMYQSILLAAKKSELKNLLILAQQIPQSAVAQTSQRLSAVQTSVDEKIEFYKGAEQAGYPPEVSQAILKGYGENVLDHSILSSSSVAVAGKMSDGSVIRLYGKVAGTGFTLWSILPALLLALVLAYRLASRLVANIGFVFKGVALTIERAGNEGGVTVKPAPEILEYEEFREQAREIAELSTQVSQRIKTLFVENKRIDYLLNNMYEGLVVFDKDLRILVINDSATNFFDSSGEMKGQNILHLTHLPSIAEALHGVTASGEPVSMDIKSPDGQKTLQIHMSAVNDEDEKTDGAIMLITDVTSVRLAEQIRSEFVANASHELKTPLTSIKGFSELINTGIISDPEKSRNYLEHIRVETERMIGLINDILKLSELESTTTDSGKVQVSLKLIAQKVCDSLVNQISLKGVTVTVEGEIGSIDANPEHMEQMILNLVDNAVKYNRPGGMVKVAVEQNTENVCIKVSDTGVGIPKASRDRVFERFYRVDKSRSRKLGGTGLGLSIVKHIVGLYKGSIWLESEEGIGTTIAITLPYSIDE
jgi:two-component system phosphate regulon sensor histidine kinase PhoR